MSSAPKPLKPDSSVSEDIFGLVECIYDAAVNPKLWPVFLQRFTSTTKEGQTALFLYDQTSGLSTYPPNSPPECDIRCAYSGGCDQHLWWPRCCENKIVERCPDGSVNAYHQLCSFPLVEDSGASVFAIMRPRRARPFGDKERLLLRALMPHLRRSLQLQQKLAAREMKCLAAAQILDRLPIGVIVVNAQGMAIFMNRAADAILAQRDGLTLGRSSLVAVRPDESTTLRELISGAIASACGDGLTTGGVMTLSRPSLKRPLSLLVLPLCLRSGPVSKDCSAAAIFVSDPEMEIEPDDAVISRLFGLTPTEAKIAVLLVQGNTPEGAAEKLEISLNTARTHLKRIFDKTGTSRQGELIPLILRSPAQFGQA